MLKLTKFRHVKKPWGQEIIFSEFVGCPFMGKILEIEPLEQVSLHLHNEKEETMYVFQGTIEVYTSDGDDIKLYQTVNEGEALHVLPKDAHSMKCISGKKAILFEVSTSYPDDSVRLKDFYDREIDKWVHPDDLADSYEKK